jgi:glycosyltransferase involved in cell wall biosynthesis
LLFVDDGSRDRTYRLLEEIAAVDSRVLVIKLRRNFGQTSALADAAPGLDHTA